MKFLKALLLSLLLSGLAVAQNFSTQSVSLSTANAPAAFGSVNETSLQIGEHSLVWVVTGSVSTCSVTIQSSTDNTTFGTLTGSAAQTCTSTGAYQTSAGNTANFIRLNVTAFTGTGSVVLTYYGRWNTPVAIPLSPGVITLNATSTFADPTDLTKLILLTASGMTTAKTITVAFASANSRTYTVGDNGGNGSFNVFSGIPATVQQPPLTVFLTGSAYTNATTTFSNVTGLSFPVLASTNYHAICRITWQGSAGTTGPKYQFTGPAAPTAVTLGMNSIVTATTVITASAVAFSSAVANTGTVTTATNFTDTVDLGVINGANAGTVQLQAAANGAGTLTIQPGSYCTVQ